MLGCLVPTAVTQRCYVSTTAHVKAAYKLSYTQVCLADDKGSKGPTLQEVGVFD